MNGIVASADTNSVFVLYFVLGYRLINRPSFMITIIFESCARVWVFHAAFIHVCVCLCVLSKDIEILLQRKKKLHHFHCSGHFHFNLNRHFSRRQKIIDFLPFPLMWSRRDKPCSMLAWKFSILFFRCLSLLTLDEQKKKILFYLKSFVTRSLTNKWMTTSVEMFCVYAFASLILCVTSQFVNVTNATKANRLNSKITKRAKKKSSFLHSIDHLLLSHAIEM